MVFSGPCEKWCYAHVSGPTGEVPARSIQTLQRTRFGWQLTMVTTVTCLHRATTTTMCIETLTTTIMVGEEGEDGHMWVTLLPRPNLGRCSVNSCQRRYLDCLGTGRVNTHHLGELTINSNWTRIAFVRWYLLCHKYQNMLRKIFMNTHQMLSRKCVGLILLT